MPEKFIIRGGKPLKGIIEVRGAKNAAFGVLVSSLLTDEEIEIHNLSLIEDALRMLEILESIGVKVKKIGDRAVSLRAGKINPRKINKDLVCLFRGSVLLFGPLLAKFKKITLPKPGGCLIGVRPIDTHLDAFLQLGANILEKKDFYTIGLSKKISDERTIILNEFSVTATENIMLFSALLPGKTTIKIADLDYPVQELANLLERMGVKIKLGFHTIEIWGKKKLNGAKHILISDPIEAGTFILTAAATKGNVIVKNVEIPFLTFFLKKLKDFGLPIRVLSKNSIEVLPWKELKIAKIQSLPYPGIPTDLLPPFGVLGTQSKGTTLLHDPLYEGRLKYLEELNKMGAKIIFCDPHRAVIEGPTQLQGQELKTLDLRGGAALIMAGLIAKGKTTIDNVYQIDRGYERIEERLQRLGADIQRITT